ncbi:MAG: FecCD family ABC transporter permease [Burkholderiales bacterium]
MRALRFSLVLAAVSAVCLIAGLMIGSVSLRPAEVVAALFKHESSLAYDIVWQLRLPRVLTAFACGGLLALAGVLLQVLLRNPLADPYILGVSGGAAVAALGAMLIGIGLPGVNFAAMVGALATIALVFTLSYRSGEWSMFRLLLTGVVLSAGFGAVISVILVVAPSGELRGMLFWLMGDLSHAQGEGWPWVLLLCAAVPAIVSAPSLDVLTTGEMQARALGVPVRALQVGIYVLASLATASAVMLGGAIGFVGLIVPHVLRLLGVLDHRTLLPAAVVLGGSFVVLADSAARSVVAPQQLPVGALTALLGVPLLLLLLSRRR